MVRAEEFNREKLPSFLSILAPACAERKVMVVAVQIATTRVHR